MVIPLAVTGLDCVVDVLTAGGVVTWELIWVTVAPELAVATMTGVTVAEVHGLAVATSLGVQPLPLMVSVYGTIASAPTAGASIIANDDAGSIPTRSPTKTSSDAARDNRLLLFTNACFILFPSFKMNPNTQNTRFCKLTTYGHSPTIAHENRMTASTLEGAPPVPWGSL